MTGKAPAMEAAREINRINRERNHVLRARSGETADVMPTEEMAAILDRHFPSREPMVKCTRHGDNCSGYECSGLMELSRVHEAAAAAKFKRGFSMREPKDLDKYIPSRVAGVRLIDLALQQILCRSTARIKWKLELSIYHEPDDVKNSKAIALPVRGTFGSGEFKE